jgi:hypothetical protein
VPFVERRDFEAEIEGGGSDDEILERNDIAYRGLLAFDAAGKLGNFQRQRVNDKYFEDFSRKGTPADAMLVAPCPMDSMREFNGGYG